MVGEPRHSSHAINIDQTRLAILRREGTSLEQTLLSIMTVGSIIWLGVIGRTIARQGDQLVILPLFGGAFLTYLVLTLATRKLLVQLLLDNQGLKHPKWLMAISLLLLSSIAKSNLLHVFTISIFILVTIDVLLQNQLHDFAVIFTNFMIYYEFTLPIFHIPFQLKFSQGISNLAIGLNIVQTHGQSAGVSPHEIDPDSAEWYDVRIVDHGRDFIPDPFTIYRTNTQDDLRDLLDSIKQFANIKIVLDQD